MPKKVLAVDFDGREVGYAFGELDETGARLCHDDSQEPGLRVPSCWYSDHNTALHDAATEAALHRRNAGQASGRPGWAAEGSRYRGEGHPNETAAVEAREMVERNSRRRREGQALIPRHGIEAIVSARWGGSQRERPLRGQLEPFASAPRMTQMRR